MMPPEGTPVVVPHIDFDTPTGNPLIEARKSYGLIILNTRPDKRKLLHLFRPPVRGLRRGPA